ncbi:NADH-quinone oxidoreductase subunit C [Streptomyces sp. V3I7]|uniref:NADH-quinone oxidoreductase subunit C n=1 Tax=Streptomyces sp. V3I7 TaxID=3042278 RepID=UPI0027808DCB|nr:NADH-quinone oxidoreductase subunit C [Streptomyces sp. V3I7]MDQ0992419.1 NADH:ubiquinone oxidoreductase subunit C [Streptomyces sp. V3I7]
MTTPTVGWLPAPVEELFGPDATAEESYEVLTVDVPPASWIPALETARTTLSCTYFDWLSAVDEPGAGFRVSAHVVALNPVRRLLVRTTVPHEAPALPSAVGVYAGAGWHERETHEMFGVRFDDHPGLEHLLLPENFEGHPLRKDFVLAARVAKAWPGAKEPGESDHGGPKRRQMLPPGVPDPNEWGPLKGQLPPAPSRPARGAARAAAGAGDRPARAAGDRPVRRARTAAEGSASQAGDAGTAAVPRRSRNASEGSASQAAAAEEASTAGTASGPAAPRRARSASQGSASQRTETTGADETSEATGAAEGSGASEGTGAADAPQRARSASGGSSSQRAQEPAAPATPDVPAEPAPRPTAPRSSDAPWHHARPAFDEPEDKRTPEAPAPEADTPTGGPQ